MDVTEPTEEHDALATPVRPDIGTPKLGHFASVLAYAVNQILEKKPEYLFVADVTDC
jgi:hypothetical protein